MPQAVKDRIFFVRFEDLIAQPVETMESIYQWLGLAAHRIDPKSLKVRPHESDSHFRKKYLHLQQSEIKAVRLHGIPVRVQDLIKKACAWYYEWFYPNITVQPPNKPRDEE